MPGGTVLGHDVRPRQLAQLGLLAVAHAQLQFRSANFDAQIHPTPFPGTRHRITLPRTVRPD